jgi:hypothetical protein
MPPTGTPDQRDESLGGYSRIDLSPEFFQETIRRYQRQKDERESRLPKPNKDALKKPPPSKKRSLEALLHDEAPVKPATKKSNTKKNSLEENHHKDEEDGNDLKKKRMASRVSSRRTREREKLRLDHFRNAKLRLEEENKMMEEDNKNLRDLIKKTRLGNASALGSLVGNQSRLVLPPMQKIISNSLPQQMASQRAPAAPPQSLDLKLMQPILAAASQQPLDLKILQPLLATNPRLVAVLSNPLLLSAAVLMGTSLQQEQAPSFMAGGDQPSTQPNPVSQNTSLLNSSVATVSVNTSDSRSQSSLPV